MPPTGILLSRAFNISLIKLNEASSVDELLLKSNWLDNVIILYVVEQSYQYDFVNKFWEGYL
jgi:hypothetical protein